MAVVPALLELLNAATPLRQWAGHPGPVAVRWTDLGVARRPVVGVQGLPDLAAVQLTGSWAPDLAPVDRRFLAAGLTEALLESLSVTACRRVGLPVDRVELAALAVDPRPWDPLRADFELRF